MKFKIVELEKVSGNKAAIYSIIILPDKGQETLFDIFLKENIGDYKDSVEDIYDELHTMGTKTGLRGNRIIPHEGQHVNDGISALCDYPDKQLRLYGILYQESVAIIGGGGPKPFGGAFQQNEKLEKENYILRRIKKVLDIAIDNGEITIDQYGIDSSTGTFIFNTEDYE